MQRTIVYPKIKLPRTKTPKEILKIWEKALGIWKKKKLDPIKYLKKTRLEWEKRL